MAGLTVDSTNTAFRSVFGSYRAPATAGGERCGKAAGRRCRIEGSRQSASEGRDDREHHRGGRGAKRCRERAMDAMFSSGVQPRVEIRKIEKSIAQGRYQTGKGTPHPAPCHWTNRTCTCISSEVWPVSTLHLTGSGTRIFSSCDELVILPSFSLPQVQCEVVVVIHRQDVVTRESKSSRQPESGYSQLTAQQVQQS